MNMTTEMARKILSEAYINGRKRMNECKPVPMVVSDGNREYFIEDGVCGFAWVVVDYKKNGAKFINALKKMDLASNDINSFADWKKHYPKGYSFWVAEGNQSYDKKKAYAKGMVEVLEKYEITCTYGYRLD